ncbi:hypothetical protein RYO59_002064 [Thermosynechococcaceae cyanobacterium Okahandja]
MLGTFQASHLRIEVPATAAQLTPYLTELKQMQQWLWPLHLEGGGDRLQQGSQFTTQLGWLRIEHRVELISAGRLVLVLRAGIEGWQEWCWGDGWVQSCIEGVTPLPLELGQTLLLWRLRAALSP